MQDPLNLHTNYQKLSQSDQHPIHHPHGLKIRNSENLQTDHLPAPLLDTIYQQTRQELQALEEKNKPYGRETITSQESINKEKYKEYEKLMRQEFEQEKGRLKMESMKAESNLEGGYDTNISSMYSPTPNRGHNQGFDEEFKHQVETNMEENFKGKTANSDLKYFNEEDLEDMRNIQKYNYQRQKDQLGAENTLFDRRNAQIDENQGNILVEYGTSKQQKSALNVTNNYTLRENDFQNGLLSSINSNSVLKMPNFESSEKIKADIYDASQTNNQSLKDLHRMIPNSSTQQKKVSYSSSSPNLLLNQNFNQTGETVSVRDELRSRKLEMIEERESEHDRAKIASSDRHLLPNQHLHKQNFRKKDGQNSRLRNKSEDPYTTSGQETSRFAKELIIPNEYSQNKLLNPSDQDLLFSKKFFNKNGKEFSAILDESSNLNLYSSKEEESSLNLDGGYKSYKRYSDNRNGLKQSGNFLNNASSGQKNHENRIELKCDRLEKENSVLIKNNDDLRFQVSSLKKQLDSSHRGGSHGAKNSKNSEEIAHLKKENEKLEQIIFKLQMELGNYKMEEKLKNHQFDDASRSKDKNNPFRTFDERRTRSKSRELNTSTQHQSKNSQYQSMSINPRRGRGQGHKTERNTENYFSLDREASKKLKFADSVVSMLGNLTENGQTSDNFTRKDRVKTGRKTDLKSSWHMLKKIVREYFDMKKASQIAQYENNNLPTAVKGEMNQFYEFQKNEFSSNLDGYKSERFNYDRSKQGLQRDHYSSHTNLRTYNG